MTVALDPLHGSLSALARFDPRWKLAALALASLATALLRSLPPAVIAALSALLLVNISGLSWHQYLRRMAALVGALSPFLAFVPFLVPGAGVDLGRLHFSWPGLILASLILAK